MLAADQRAAVHLDAAAIAALLDPVAYTGLCADIARAGADRARSAVSAIGRHGR